MGEGRMTRYLTVNRSLADKAMDKIDHALGRPLDPLKETYRDHYAVDKDSAIAAEFRDSPHWEEGRASGLNQKMAWFYVTDAGRSALASYLKSIGDAHKSFNVSFRGYDGSVVAKTRSEARYSRFLEIADVDPDLTFKEFCKTATVRRVAA